MIPLLRHSMGRPWYRNVLKNPAIRMGAWGAEAGRAIPTPDAKSLKSVIEKFREKYGAKDVKKYSKFDVAVLVELD